MLPLSPPHLSPSILFSLNLSSSQVSLGASLLCMMSLWSRVNSPCWCSVVHFESILILLKSIHTLSWWQTSAIDKVVTPGTLCVRTWTEFKLCVGVFTITWMACGFAASRPCVLSTCPSLQDSASILATWDCSCKFSLMLLCSSSHKGGWGGISQSQSQVVSVGERGTVKSLFGLTYHLPAHSHTALKKAYGSLAS